MTATVNNSPLLSQLHPPMLPNKSYTELRKPALPPIRRKAVVVGDGCSGKTSLLQSVLLTRGCMVPRSCRLHTRANSSRRQRLLQGHLPRGTYSSKYPDPDVQGLKQAKFTPKYQLTPINRITSQPFSKTTSPTSISTVEMSN